MERIKEIHVTTVFGVPIIRKYIEVCDAQERPQIDEHGYNGSQPPETFKHVKQDKQAKIVALILIFLAVVFLVYKPPQVFDNLINVVMRDCPEKLQLDQVQSTLKITSYSLSSCTHEKTKRDDDLKICSNEKEASGKKLSEEKSKTHDLENSLIKGKGDIERLEKSEKDLQNNIASVTKEKDNLHKKVGDTEVMLGTCRNKNMDHEIEKSELVKKLLKAERELKNCH